MKFLKGIAFILLYIRDSIIPKIWIGFFFQELELKEPDENLNVGSCLPGEQVGKIIIGAEKAINRYKPDLVVVHGDTNTTLGGAIAAQQNIKRAESGLPM